MLGFGVQVLRFLANNFATFEHRVWDIFLIDASQRGASFGVT